MCLRSLYPVSFDKARLVNDAIFMAATVADPANDSPFLVSSQPRILGWLSYGLLQTPRRRKEC